MPSLAIACAIALGKASEKLLMESLPILPAMIVVPVVVVLDVPLEVLVLEVPGVIESKFPCKAAPKVDVFDLDTSQTRTSTRTSALGRSRSWINFSTRAMVSGVPRAMIAFWLATWKMPVLAWRRCERR